MTTTNGAFWEAVVLVAILGAILVVSAIHVHGAWPRVLPNSFTQSKPVASVPAGPIFPDPLPVPQDPIPAQPPVAPLRHDPRAPVAPTPAPPPQPPVATPQQPAPAAPAIPPVPPPTLDLSDVPRPGSIKRVPPNNPQLPGAAAASGSQPPYTGQEESASAASSPGIEDSGLPTDTEDGRGRGNGAGQGRPSGSATDTESESGSDSDSGPGTGHNRQGLRADGSERYPGARPGGGSRTNQLGDGARTGANSGNGGDGHGGIPDLPDLTNEVQRLGFEIENLPQRIRVRFDGEAGDDVVINNAPRDAPVSAGLGGPIHVLRAEMPAYETDNEAASLADYLGLSVSRRLSFWLTNSFSPL